MSALSRMLRRLGTTRWFARVAAPLAAPLDRIAFRVRRGRGMLTPAELGAVMLTTLGRHSGAERRTPLLFVEHDEGFVVVGTNWGRSATPDWVLNLEANPRATVEVQGVGVSVDAIPIESDDQRQWWDRLEDHYPGYAAYRERAAGRRIRLFLLRRR